VARKKKLGPVVLARRVLFFVLGSLLMGILAVILEVMLREVMPRHFSVSLAVGFAVAITFALLRFLKHPPMFLKNVHPLAAGLCAGLGVHIARTWLR
jgi:peptidoglycan/LPS O-acetylase OafA/YrhL